MKVLIEKKLKTKENLRRKITFCIKFEKVNNLELFLPFLKVPISPNYDKNTSKQFRTFYKKDINYFYTGTEIVEEHF